MSQLKLKCSDGVEVKVDVAVMCCSNTIKTMIENLGGGGGDGEGEDESIPLQNVRGDTLKKVVEWATHHKNDPPPVDDDEAKAMHRSNNINGWDAAFINVDRTTLFELILAANYLDIKGLMDLTTKTVANMIRGKSPATVRKLLDIKNDFTPAEEGQIRKESAWCEEESE